jgi:hypothetical protein
MLGGRGGNVPELCAGTLGVVKRREEALRVLRENVMG